MFPGSCPAGHARHFRLTILDERMRFAGFACLQTGPTAVHPEKDGLSIAS